MMKEADENLAEELATYIENDGDLYRQQYQPQVLNLARRRYKGEYDAKLAIKLVVYLVESGLKKYRKEFGLTEPVNRATKEAAAKQILLGMQDEINGKVLEIAKKTRTPKAKKPKAVKPPASYGPLQETNPDKPGMQIRIREGAMGMPNDRFSPINWKWVAVMRLAAGRTFYVETEYLFEDQYNTAPVLPVFVDDWIAELVKKEPIYEGRQKDLAEAKISLTTTGLRIMDSDVAAVINDARPGKMRCHWCGKTNPVASSCPSCGKAEYLEPFGGPWIVTFTDNSGRGSGPVGYKTEAEALKNARAVVGPSSAWQHAFVHHRGRLVQEIHL